jgi:hypothetical protein
MRDIVRDSWWRGAQNMARKGAQVAHAEMSKNETNPQSVSGVKSSNLSTSASLGTARATSFANFEH